MASDHQSDESVWPYRLLYAVAALALLLSILGYALGSPAGGTAAAVTALTMLGAAMSCVDQTSRRLHERQPLLAEYLRKET